MSSSEHARPVWLTREQRDSIRLWRLRVGDEIVAAWDAAPADAERAVGVVLHHDHPDPPCQACEDTISVLRALRYPAC